MIRVYDDAITYGLTVAPVTNFERYTGEEVNRALMQQNIADIDHCVGAGWLTVECRAFDNSSIVQWCKGRGLDQSAAHLLDLGFSP